MLRPQGEHLVQRGEPFVFEYRIEPGTGVELLQLRERKVGGLARAAGGPVQHGVVQDDELAVFRPANVQFNADAQFKTSPHVRQGVLGRMLEQTAVPDDQRATERTVLWFSPYRSTGLDDRKPDDQQEQEPGVVPNQSHHGVASSPGRHRFEMKV